MPDPFQIFTRVRLSQAYLDRLVEKGHREVTDRDYPTGRVFMVSDYGEIHVQWNDHERHPLTYALWQLEVIEEN